MIMTLLKDSSLLIMQSVNSDVYTWQPFTDRPLSFKSAKS